PPARAATLGWSAPAGAKATEPTRQCSSWWARRSCRRRPRRERRRWRPAVRPSKTSRLARPSKPLLQRVRSRRKRSRKGTVKNQRVRGAVLQHYCLGGEEITFFHRELRVGTGPSLG